MRPNGQAHECISSGFDSRRGCTILTRMKIRLSEFRQMIREEIRTTLVEAVGATYGMSDMSLNRMSRKEIQDKITDIDADLPSAEGHQREVLLHWKNRLKKRLAMCRS